MSTAIEIKGKPWDQQPGESPEAYAVFTEYLHLGDHRSLKAVAAKLSRQLSIIARWSKKWHWQERVTRWHEHLVDVRTKRIEILQEADAVDWVRRQKEHREKEYDLAQKGFEILRRWINELAKRKRVKMSAAEAAKLLDVCSRIGRLAAGMATNRDEISGIDGEPIKVEVLAAIAKVYGPAITVEEVNGNSCTSESDMGIPMTEEKAND